MNAFIAKFVCVFYVNAVSVNRKQSAGEIIKTIKASYVLKEKNERLKVYNQDLFYKHIDRVIVRTIRNSQEYNMEFYKFLKNESGYFDKIPLIDKSILFLKCKL